MRKAIMILCLLWSQSALAGAWMQEHKQGFLSYSTVYDDTGRLDGTIYLEYGLRPKLTFGAKVDVDMTSGQVGDGTAFVFARKPIPTGDRAFKLAYDFGVGSTFGGETDPILRAGFSYGRGIKAWDKHGWLAIDAAAEWTIDDTPDTYKLDTTLGLALSDRFKVMMQVFVSETGGDVTTTLAPSLIWQPRPKAPSFVIGIEGEDGTFALKLGMWRSF